MTCLFNPVNGTLATDRDPERFACEILLQPNHLPRTFKPNGRVTSASLNRHHEFDLAIRWNRRYRLEKNTVLTYVVARTFNFVTLAIELEFEPEWIPERKTGVPPPLVPNRIVVEGSQCSSKLAKSGLAKFKIAKSPRLHRIDTPRRRQVHDDVKVEPVVRAATQLTWLGWSSSRLGLAWHLPLPIQQIRVFVTHGQVSSATPCTSECTSERYF